MEKATKYAVYLDKWHDPDALTEVLSVHDTEWEAEAAVLEYNDIYMSDELFVDMLDEDAALN